MASPNNPTRFYSLALGKFDNFRSVSSGVIGLGDTTPSVKGLSLLYAQSGGTLTLSNFDDGSEGQLLVLVNAGSQLRYLTSGYLKVSTDALTFNGVATFINHYAGNSSIWYQISNNINFT